MNKKGLSVFELLIAAAIFAIVLGVVTSYFVNQSRDTRLTQNRNEAQDRTRVVLQLVSQDLLLAGSSRFVRSGQVGQDSAWVSCAPSTPCIVATNNGLTDSFVSRYHTSLYPSGQECRSVGYRFSGTTLQRADVSCAAASTGNIASNQYRDLAQNIIQLQIRYVCGDSGATEVDVPSACNALANPQDRYVRAAFVTVTAQALNTNATYTWQQRIPIRNLKALDEVL